MPANVLIQLRRGTAAQWTAANPVLNAGESGFETDTKRTKIGDGTTAWTALAYTDAAQKGIPNGVATLDANSKVPKAQVANVLALADLSDGAAQAAAITAKADATATSTALAAKADAAATTAALSAKIGAIARTAAQLAGVPSAPDIALGAGAQFYDSAQVVDATHPWVYYCATSTGYVKIGGGAATGNATPRALGAAAAGSAVAAAHEDHVHPMPTARQTGALAVPSSTWNGATNTAYDANGVSLGALTAGTAPPIDVSFVVVGCPTPTAVSISPNFLTVTNDDIIYFPSVNWQKIGVSSIGRQTAAIQKGDNNAGSGGSALIDASPYTGDYRRGPALLANVAIGYLPDLLVGANGAFTIGTQTGGGTLTFAQTAAGTAIAVTASAAAFASTDVGRTIVVGGVLCPVTAFTSSTQVAVTIPAGGISTVGPWASWTIGGSVFGLSSAVIMLGIAQFAANSINGSNPAGLYPFVMTNGLVGTVYNNLYTPGVNSGAGSLKVPTLTPFSGTTGSASSAGTAALTTHQLTIPGGMSGANAIIETKAYVFNNNSAGSKVFAGYFYGSTSPFGLTVTNTTTQAQLAGGTYFVDGQTNRVSGVNVLFPSTNPVGVDLSPDMTADQVMQFKVTRTATTDYAFYRSVFVDVISGA